MLFLGLGTLLVAMGVTWMVTPGVIRLAGLLGAMDLPGERKAHSEPIPRIGGLAVFAGFAASLLFAAAATDTLGDLGRSAVDWRGLALVAMGLMVVGLIDDLWHITFHWKFAAQILAALLVWDRGFRIEVLANPLGGALDLGWLSLPVTVLWIVGITNAVNLIDGLDGLASGIALITTATVAVMALAQGKLGVTAACVALAGSLIGFLRFNFNPARIFLGDSGSLFLGFVLAVTSVRGSQKGPTAVAILVPLIVLGLPVLDTVMAVLRRLYRLQIRGRRHKRTLAYIVLNVRELFLPDREHIHHRLLDTGLSHRSAVLILYAVGVLFAAAAYGMMLIRNVWVALLLLGVLGATMAILGGLLYLRNLRRLSEKDAAAGSIPVPEPLPEDDRFAASPQRAQGR